MSPNTPWPRRQFTRHALALAAAPLAAWLPAGPALALAAGDAAPDLSLPGANGPVNLADLRGKLVYLDFWASWCGPCRKSFPWMGELQDKLGSKGLQVLAINLDAKREDAERFLAQTPARFALAFDAKGDSAKRFGIKGMPSSVLIGPDGKVLMQHSGFRDDDKPVLEQQINAALPGR